VTKSTLRHEIIDTVRHDTFHALTMSTKEFYVLALDRVGLSDGRRSRQGAAASSWYAKLSNVASRPTAAAKWLPIGQPWLLTWRGTLIAGALAMV
jgi:hypothetical protein